LLSLWTAWTGSRQQVLKQPHKSKPSIERSKLPGEYYSDQQDCVRGTSVLLKRMASFARESPQEYLPVRAQIELICMRQLGSARRLSLWNKWTWSGQIERVSVLSAAEKARAGISPCMEEHADLANKPNDACRAGNRAWQLQSRQLTNQVAFENNFDLKPGTAKQCRGFVT
jgi:hypothetical protein